MVERVVKEAINSLDSKLAYISGVMTSDVMEQRSKKHSDDHLKTDIQGINSALRGEYKAAAKILKAESQYNENDDVRKNDNGLVALANTMYAVSLLKDNKFDDAEYLLKTERARDLSGLNKIDDVKDLNKRALRLALLQQGKHDQVKYMDITDEIMGLVKVHNLSIPLLETVIAQKNAHISQAGALMGKMQKEMLDTFDDSRRRQLMQQQTDLCHSSNADSLAKLQAQGMLATLTCDSKTAEAFFKACFDVIDKDDQIRLPGKRDMSNIHQVDPEITQIASTLYAYALAEQNKFAQAEERFAREVERDQKGLNSSDSTVKRLNQLGLEYARLKQGKPVTAEVAHGSNVQLGAMTTPAPRAVFLR